MTEKKPETFQRLRWPAALVLTVMIAGSAAIYVLVEHDRSATLIGWGTLCALFLAQLRPMVVRLLPLAFLVIAAAPGCTSAEGEAFRNTMKPVVDVGCAIARKIVQGCPLAEALVGSTPGGETSGGEFIPEPEVEDVEP